jgi:outer membrane receptor protein involved in Fe transport
MKKLIQVLTLLIISSAGVFAQGTVRGKITDEKGNPQYNAKVFFKSDRTKISLSDFDGNFSIETKSTEPDVLVISLANFETIEDTIRFKNTTLILQDYSLEPKAKAMTAAVVKKKRPKANDLYMENIKKNSATTIDYVSSETMKKTGDPNVTAAVSRVSGVSTNGGLITVRGIGDRYVKTTLNGSRIPTLDPLTNNIRLDIFPASLVDNIIITKTASPDLPGDFSGAYLSVETKDYPEKLDVNVESQFGYNAQTTFKDVITSQRSATDYLGYDNGLRNRNDEKIISPTLNPSTYQEMVALGLGSYYSHLGVKEWKDGSPEGDAYFKMGLVQLGLLSKGSMDDASAVKEAKMHYDAEYKNKAFDLINPNGTDYNNKFSHNWNTTKMRAPINFSQSFSIGNQLKLFGKPLGFVVGFRYGNSIRFDPNGVSQRLAGGTAGFETQDNAQISRETNGWSSLLNLAYKFNDKNSLSFMFMPNISGTNDVANFNTRPDGTKDQEVTARVNQFYEQRKQLIYQVKTEHFLPKTKTKIEFNTSYTNGSSIAPDFKVLQYGYMRNNTTDSVFNYQFSPTADPGIRRYFRYLNENILDSRISAEIPLKSSTPELVRKLKFGGAFQYTDRKSNLEEYYLLNGNSDNTAALMNNDLDGYLSADKFVLKNRKLDYFFSPRDYARNHTFGHSSISSGFAMMDYAFISGLRLAGGLRVEQSQIFTDVVDFYAKGYGKNDVRRENVGGYALINAANLNETNFLPSANVVYKLKKITAAQVNVRLNYSATVARPSIRELNDGAIYDNEFRTLIYGNSNLKNVHIKNYDFRAESYFKNGDNISVSLFYKDFRNHIEMGFGAGGVTWQNIDKSTVKGLEFEGKKSLGPNFEIRANVTLVKSNSAFVRKEQSLVNNLYKYTPLDTINRPMFGQAPYIINGIMTYKSDSLGISASLSYNVQGPRLVITGVVKGFPDVYEMPRHTIDFKISKKLGKRYSTSLMVRDILNARVRRAYKTSAGYIDYDNFRYGTNFIVSLAYKF